MLTKLLVSRTDYKPIEFEVAINHQQPVYIVEPAKKNDAHLILVSRTKKARWKYRSFDPDEDVRLSASDAIRHVAQSAGVIAPLQLDSVQNSREQNIRAMFVAGLALALEIPTLIIHPAEFSPPLDVRDFTKKYRHPDDITDAVQAFSLEITDFSQQAHAKDSSGSTVLTRLSVGDPTAENEMTSLADYYLSTDEYQKALRGEVNLVVGRKGSGKTALFVQLRDAKRSRRANIVVDLKPEGFQLVKLKERVLDFLTEGGRSLMRPRNLLKLFRSSLSYAINLGHTRIAPDDITRGLRTYAQDLVIEVDRELGDVFPQARKLVYEFSEENAEFSHDDLSTLVQCMGLDPGQRGARN
jgi:hypothetical protein